MMRFHSTVKLGGKTATGIPVPDDVVEGLGSHRRPPVRVTVNGHTYRTTVASMGGVFMLPLSAENRQKAGTAAGDEVDVDLELDTEPREVTVPPDLADALAGDDTARQLFESLAPSHKRAYVTWIEEAKQDATRQRRVEGTVTKLQAGKKTP